MGKWATLTTIVVAVGHEH